MVLNENFHTHTVFCDGSDSPEDVVRQAVAKGMPALGFSGHMDPDIHMDLPAYLREIRRLEEKYKDRIEILCGIELDVLYADEVFGRNWSGVYQSVLCDPEDKSLAKIDYIIGSTHFLKAPDGTLIAVDNTEKILTDGCEKYYGGDYYQMAEEYFKLEKTAYEKTHCTFIGHFDLITRFNDSMHFLDENNPAYRRPALETMEHLVRQGAVFEVNCGAVNRSRKKEFYPNEFLLRALCDMGGEIIISSDAHQKELLTGAFPEAVETVKKCGFRHINVLRRGKEGVVLEQRELA